ncbi:MAG: hypothetical protein ACFFB0_12705 [Promethearchaeota archaeon]
MFSNILQNNYYKVDEKSEIDDLNKEKNPNLSAQETLTTVWYKNPTFEDPIEPIWYSELNGDLSDINATSGSGQANYEILGETHTFSEISGIPLSTEWTQVHNPDFPDFPDTATIIANEGCYVSHYWDEKSDQAPSVHWERNITMPVNMSDYIITSVSLSALVNATVQATDYDNGGIDVFGDTDVNGATYDYVKFYILFSDITKNKVYEVAAYQSTDLGKDSAGTWDYLYDTYLENEPQDKLIEYLTSVLNTDYKNFTITLGIRLWCEDSSPGLPPDDWDEDNWQDVIIKSCNLSFTYEKKIDQFNSISWNQDGDKINTTVDGTTVTIKEAKLNFKYKINENWTNLSPNSEFRIFINNNKLTETIKLSKATSDFQLAKEGGFDVTSLTLPDIKLNLSIEVYLADEFNLGVKKIISIDDVYLNITYTVNFPDTQTNLQVFFNGENKTNNPIFQISAKTDLNITVKYPDAMGNHIPQAIVELTGNLTGFLQENETLEQYTIIIDTEDLPIGEIYFDIVAHRINYEAQKVGALLTVSKINTQSLQIFLNGEEKTSFPFLDVPLNKLLNITVKYKDTTGDHISGAAVQLIGEGILEDLEEDFNFEQYTVLLNTSIKFQLGVNNLLINAEKERYQEESINPKITVRKINTQIISMTGSNNINIRPGKSATISVFINDTDFNKIIKGLTLTYTWEFGDGILKDDNNDGIYEVILNNVPVGTHYVNISAFGSDIYRFETYRITINALRPKQNMLLFQILLTIGIIASGVIAGYIYAYQKILKYPRQVRKVRKYRKTLKKKKAPSGVIKTRETTFNSAYQKELNKTSRFVKGKATFKKSEEQETPEKKRGEPKLNSGSKSENNINSNTNSTGFDKQKSFSKQKLIILRKLRLGLLKPKKIRRFISILIVTILLLSPFIISFYIYQNSKNPLRDDNSSKIRISGQKTNSTEWLKDTSFDNLIDPIWFASYGDLGDRKDVNAILGPGYANMTVRGDNGTFSAISGIPSSTDWLNVTNPDFPALPDFNEIDEDGCRVSHTWIDPDDPFQIVSIHWDNNITLPVNMSDYIITSVSLSAVINASVTTVGTGPLYRGGVDVEGDTIDGSDPDFAREYDYVRFYVLISDLDKNDVFEAAYNQTTNLGQDSPPIATISDTEIFTRPEESLISYLNTVLENDPDHQNFTLTLGMRIYCADNGQGDRDTWDSLRFKSCNFSLSYEKKIDQFTSVSWNQDAKKISDISSDPEEEVVVNEAIMNFKYKIDQNWTELSPNSELRILINGNPHTETVKLSTANETFQEGKIDGFDVTHLITDDVNVSIQLFLTDKFRLNRNITVSIDDVTLNITYTIFFPPRGSSLQLFINNENKTLDPNFELYVGEQLNITIKYLNETGVPIPNATVSLSGNFTGTLKENKTFGQYSIIIDTDISNIGVNFLTITAYAEDYVSMLITPVISIIKFDTKNLQVFLNNENKTLNPEIELRIEQELNITVRYSDSMGNYVPNATVRLKSEGITKDLNESSIFKQYTTIINTADRFKIGLNYLTIEAQHIIHQTEFAVIRLYIRKINIDIATVSGSDRINTQAGKDITLKVNLNNTDLGVLVTGANVTYSWVNGGGILKDPDNDGIYEATIENIPQGTFTITISAFAGDDYEAQDYEITVVAAGEDEAATLLFQTLFILSVVIALGLVSYLIAYQKYLKFPRPVRKVRKFRKTLRKKKAPSINIVGREVAFKSVYNKEVGTFPSDIKLKRIQPKFKKTEEKEIPDKIKAKPLEQEMESDKLIDKSIEKKEELDELVDKSSK